MALADSLQIVASKVITRFGGEVKVRYISTEGYDIATGTIRESDTYVSTKGIVEDVTSREVNELIQAGDKRLTIAALDLSVAPQVKDRITIEGVMHQVIEIRKQEQDNKPITYELILRS